MNYNIVKKPTMDNMYVFVMPKVMGDYYIIQSIDNFKTKDMNPDVVFDVYDNHDDVQVGQCDKDYIIILIGYQNGSIIEPSVKSFIENLNGAKDLYGSVLILNEKTPSVIKTFIHEVNLMMDNVYEKEELLEITRTVLDNYGVDEDIVDSLLIEIGNNTLDFTAISEEDIPEPQREVVVPKSRTKDIVPVVNEPEPNIEPEIDIEHEDANASAPVVTSTFAAAMDRKIISLATTDGTLDEEMYFSLCEEVSSKLIDLLLPNTNKIEVVKGEAGITGDTIEVKESDQVPDVAPEEVIEEDITEEELEQYTAMESKSEKKKAGNKMQSDRALELVKTLNSRWLQDIFPNVMHKLESIDFFKSNIGNFKVNAGDKPEDIVAKVAGGVVHVEVLKKNLSTWNNENANWKIDDEKTIKRSQKSWRREFVKFKNSILESIVPLLKSLLHVNEELEIIDDEDSIDLCIVNNVEEVKPIEEVHSTESDTTNIYNTVTLESLKLEANSDDELFELVCSTESLVDRDTIMMDMTKKNLFNGNNEMLPIDISIKRRVAVQMKKYK